MNIYKKTSSEMKMQELKSITKNSWINLINPNIKEIKEVVGKTNIDENLIMKMLDEEELPRIEVSGKSTLIVIDVPIISSTKYKTYPLGIIVSKDNYFVTISLKKTEVLGDFLNDKVRDFTTTKRTRFLIQILIRTAATYIRELKNINQDIQIKEKILIKSTGNKHLIDLLSIEKTLVYFITSLKANDVVLEKLTKGSIFNIFEEDLDLLEDANIEIKQAIDMSIIYRDILSSITDTYATIVSNNLNIVMKFLAGITIVFSIPTMISSFLGMNVPLGDFSKNEYSFIIISFISILIALIIGIWLKKKDML